MTEMITPVPVFPFHKISNITSPQNPCIFKKWIKTLGMADNSIRGFPFIKIRRNPTIAIQARVRVNPAVAVFKINKIWNPYPRVLFKEFSPQTIKAAVPASLARPLASLLRAERYRWSQLKDKRRDLLLSFWHPQLQLLDSWNANETGRGHRVKASEIIKISAFATWKGSEQPLRKSIRVFYLQWHRCLSQ